MTFDPLRRARLDQMTPAELAIYTAMQAVEAMGADERLTRAVILLADAKYYVADFVDGIPMKKELGESHLRSVPKETSP